MLDPADHPPFDWEEQRRQNRAYARRQKRDNPSEHDEEKPAKAKKKKSNKRPRQPNRREREKAWRKDCREYSNELWSHPALPGADRVYRALGSLAQKSLRVTASKGKLLTMCGPGVKWRTVQEVVNAGITAGLWRRGDPGCHPGEREKWLYVVARDRDQFAGAWKRRLGVAAALLDVLLASAHKMARKGLPVDPFGSATQLATATGRSSRAVQRATPVLRNLGIEIGGVTNDKGRGVTGEVMHYRFAYYPEYPKGEPAPPQHDPSPPGRRKSESKGPSESMRPVGSDGVAPLLATPRQPLTHATRSNLQDLYDGGFVLPPDDDLPAYRELVAGLPADDKLLPFGVAILIPEIAAQLDLVRSEIGKARKNETLARLLADYDPEQPHRLAELDWVQRFGRALDERWG